MAEEKSKAVRKSAAVFVALAAVAAVFGVEIGDADLTVAKDAAASVIGGGALLFAFGKDLLGKIGA